MDFTVQKLAARIDELSRYRYRDVTPISEFLSQDDPDGAPGVRPPHAGNWRPMHTGDDWSGRDRYVWLKARVDVPEQLVGRRVVGLFDFGITGGGTNSGFESLLYVDDVPYQGVDQNHQEVFLPPDQTAYHLVFRLWSGLEGGGVPIEQHHRLRRADLAWLDDSMDDLYYTARAVWEVASRLDENRAERVRLLGLLDDALSQVNWTTPGSTEFYASAEAAREHLWGNLNALRKDEAVTVHAVGHTHIDVAWLWRLKHTREKSARSFSSALRLMEQYPEYTFLQSQPQLYAYLAKDYPELYEQIKMRIQEGRWEPGGAMWLEADCNLTSGESLVRQVIYGKRFLREQFGVDCRYLWLPDVFGYSWALPQILKKAGIDVFVTSKLSWNETNRIPHDTFVWRGMDGTEVMTHFLTTPTPGRGYTYNGLVSAGDVAGTWEAYLDKDMNQELLIPFGYGDGGGGPNRDMLEMRRRLDAIPGVPNLPVSRADRFFDDLRERLESWGGRPKVWDGELYLEYHRGTYTSQARNKRENRKLELALRETEWLNVLAGLADLGRTWPQAALRETWTVLLRNQFHDIIPGSSIHEVYEDSLSEYEAAWRTLASAREPALASLGASAKAAAGVAGAAEGDRRLAVFNSAPWSTSALVQVPDAGCSWVDPDGAPLPVQQDGDERWAYVEEVPALGFRTFAANAAFSASDEEDAGSWFKVHSSGVTTARYKVEWNESGQWTRLYDRDANREVFSPGERGNVLQVFEDKPLEFDAWNIDAFFEEKYSEVTELESWSVDVAGPLFARVHMVWRYADSRIEQDIVFYNHAARIDFRTTVDWEQSQELLKVAFPVDVRVTEATFDIQFGNVQRTTHANTSWDAAQFETVGHQWADLSERGYGVSLLNDCKYGYDVKGHTLRLTLLKSAIYPDPAADRGRHEFTYSLLPHMGDWYQGGTVQAAWDLNSPPFACLAFADGVSTQRSLLHLSNDNVMVDAVKQAEDGDGYVLRIHEFAGMRTMVEATGELAKGEWQACDLLEQAEGPRMQSPVQAFELRPYELKTFRVRMV